MLEPTPPGGPVESAPEAPEPIPDSEPDRRAFLRQLSGDAVSTAGRLAGFSSIIRRSVFAAGEAATRGLGDLSDDRSPISTTHDGASSGGTPVPHPPLADSAPLAGTAPLPDPAPLLEPAPFPASIRPDLPDPVLALTPAQHDFLANATRAALAVNDPAGAPQMTSSMFHWDGTLVRLPGQMFTARVTNVDRDPRVSLLVDDPTTEAWVAITGVATMVYGEDAEGETRLILAKYFADHEAARRWEEMAASGDRIVIRVRPTRFVWRPA
jgi:PPOX class probable F420-dependent enzyme